MLAFFTLIFVLKIWCKKAKYGFKNKIVGVKNWCKNAFGVKNIPQ